MVIKIGFQTRSSPGTGFLLSACSALDGDLASSTRCVLFKPSDVIFRVIPEDPGRYESKWGDPGHTTQGKQIKIK